MQLSDLLNGLVHVLSKDDVSVNGLSLDSRKVTTGNLFFAILGNKIDARIFIKKAINNGAVAILAERQANDLNCYYENSIPVFLVDNLNHIISQISSRFYKNPGNLLNLIAVTGTNGKTSCTYYISTLLKYVNQRCALIGTLGCGIIGDIIKGDLTTPDAITIQKTLLDFVNKNIKHVAMEVSSHSLDQGRVNYVPFNIGVFTNLTRDHLDYHETMENYAKSKAKLFENPWLEYAIINLDDIFGKKLINEINGAKIIGYSLSSDNDYKFPVVYAQQIKSNYLGLHAKVYTPWGDGEFYTNLLGDFNLSNLLAVITVLGLQKIPLKVILEGISKLSSPPGRMQLIGGNNKPYIIIDYSHTPDSLEKALLTLNKYPLKKLICVFGCGGERDKGKRPIMARIAEKLSDIVIVTDDNPRTENAGSIVLDIIKGFLFPDKVILIHEREKAIQEAINLANPGDCILIAGKGSENYQQIGLQKIPFSDLEKANLSLESFDRSEI
ncbi:UDP-N-acetylmuramoyl-L-alanyl-D-glutamate--2,6-diaminopimelate ligase [Gammaproteobacteria bacterium]|nr:UDP-N-acetylmuramoyl-L-alanyl-D-glutamate--2,6-diaminopimelate ligase [Gammaproteobacteria bacterium]